MLEPVNQGFRFLDLPSELRNHVYSILLEEDGPISMWSHKILNEARRPVRYSYRYTDGKVKRDGSNGKRVNSEHSSAAILGVSKQVHAEAASILYGSNSFTFAGIKELQPFLARTASMRKYLTHVQLRTDSISSHTRLRATFKLLGMPSIYGHS